MEMTTNNDSLVNEISAIPGGEHVNLCIQCGSCTASCPNADLMQHTPANIIALIRANYRQEVLTSTTPWYCLSCYMCTSRCPRGVKPTNIMHAIEEIALREGVESEKTTTPALYRSFNHYVVNNGYVPEAWFMMRYLLTTNPFKAFSMASLGIGLFSRGRISLKSRKLSSKSRRELKTILAKAETLGGAD